MMNFKTISKKWLWLVPVAVLLAGAVGFSLSRPRNALPAEELTPAPTASPVPKEPALMLSPGYFPAEELLFTPEEPFTRGLATDILSRLTGTEVNFGLPDSPMTESFFPVFLREYFDAAAVEEAMMLIRGRGDETITRAEAVVCLNRLGSLIPAECTGYYPDVAPEYWAHDDILAATGESDAAEVLPQGFVNLDGWLYCVDERGYFLTNHWVGTLFFDEGGRYTCGNEELDTYVAQAISENTGDDMTREEMLRGLYEYIRDNFKYFRRNYYRTGDMGWHIQEALTMYSTGKGNCYCYASAFWAAARGLGYDAKIVSGTVGAEDSPHGWVEIVMDGTRYTYDVELEMARHRDGYPNTNLYKMTNGQRRSWNYVGADYSDDKFHRETEAVLLPG